MVDFSLFTNFVALKGGKLKSEQIISGEMADIFSNLYLAVAANYYEKLNNVSPLLTSYITRNLINENIYKINNIIANLGIEKIRCITSKTKTSVSRDYKTEKVYLNIYSKTRK